MQTMVEERPQIFCSTELDLVQPVQIAICTEADKASRRMQQQPLQGRQPC